MNDLNRQKLGDSVMEVSLAKPQGDKMKERKRMREGFRGGPPPGPGFVRGGRGGPWGHPGLGRGGFGGGQ